MIRLDSPAVCMVSAFTAGGRVPFPMCYDFQKGALSMYLHLGQDALVKTKEVIGIFDMDNTTVSKGTRKFLTAAEKKGRVVTVTADLPKTFVLCGSSREDCKVYLSQISSHTLRKRTRSGVR